MTKILIAEDEKAIASALATKFKAEGYEVDLAEDGEIAIEKVQKGGIDLLILDLMMPKKDGFQVLEELKKAGNTTNVVVASNLSQESDINKVKELGAKDFFVKSDTPLAEICELIKKYI